MKCRCHAYSSDNSSLLEECHKSLNESVSALLNDNPIRCGFFLNNALFIATLIYCDNSDAHAIYGFVIECIVYSTTYFMNKLNKSKDDTHLV